MYVGVDVGGTNTDAVMMDRVSLVGAAKVPTTTDVTSGIVGALTELLDQQPGAGRIEAVMVGTTHFTNALLGTARTGPHRRAQVVPAGHAVAAAVGGLAGRIEGGRRRPHVDGGRRQRV